MTTKIPEQTYYYLGAYNQRTVKGYVNLNALRTDIARGVKTLSEDAYSRSWGVTRTSLAFYRTLTLLLGEENCKAKSVEVSLTQKHHFVMRLTTVTGLTFVFRGIGSGYYGEGSRGAHDIMVASGFTKAQADRVFKEENFTIRKRTV